MRSSTLIAIDRISDLMREVFGPVLHVLRFPREGLDALMEAIDATGYGLTFGVHSRIAEAPGVLVPVFAATTAGLDAGRDDYPRDGLFGERSVSIDTAAGGNASLMAMA